ncbi:hypothetical protein V5O48_006853 [Marasmius crinis-equi]|uniref:Uncharacterized protein n=1 Tax=Marasmius crinis-equi TaxID=585013 RepID=A0ABR3FID4_9AGAR
MYGGIVGRLARELVPEDTIVHGPDPDLVYTHGWCYWDTPEGVYWDDELLPEEIDLICGLYIVETDSTEGTFGSLSQVSHMSWWPQPNQFDTGGLNIGFWTRDCEKWFQNRLRECRSTPKLMNATKWRNAMNMKQSSRRVPKKNETIAQEFLKNLLGSQ